MVILSDAHERLVNTSPDQLPGRLHLKLPPLKTGIPVTYLFARMPRSPPAKSSALPAALKRANGFDMSTTDKLELARRAIQIGSRDCCLLNCDAIVPMPSSSDLVMRISRVLQARLPNHPPILQLLRKRSNAEVLAVAPGIHEVSEPQRDVYQRECRRLARSHGTRPFEAKRVPVRLRRYFSPLELTERFMPPNTRSILIVDDVFSTGSTFSYSSDIAAHGVGRYVCEGTSAIRSCT